MSITARGIVVSHLKNECRRIQVERDLLILLLFLLGATFFVVFLVIVLFRVFGLRRAIAFLVLFFFRLFNVGLIVCSLLLGSRVGLGACYLSRGGRLVSRKRCLFIVH